MHFETVGAAERHHPPGPAPGAPREAKALSFAFAPQGPRSSDHVLVATSERSQKWEPESLSKRGSPRTWVRQPLPSFRHPRAPIRFASN